MNNSEPNTNEKEIQSISFSKALSKVSKKGLLVNKRILQLYEGQLKYYNFLKKFVEDDYVPGEFKWGVYVKDIISVEVQGQKKKDRISIEFLEGNMFDKEKKTESSEKQKNNKIRWEFVCSSCEQATLIVEKINLVKKLLDIGERQKREKEVQKALQKKQIEGQENLQNQKEKELEKDKQQQQVLQASKQPKQSSSQKQQTLQSSSGQQPKEKRQKQQVIDEKEEDNNFKQLRTQIRDYSIKKKEEQTRQYPSPQAQVPNQLRKEESKNSTLVNFDQSFPSSSSAEKNKNITSIAVLQQQQQQSTQRSQKQSSSIDKNQLEGRKVQDQSQEQNQIIKEPTKEQKDQLKEQAKLAKKQEKLAKEQAKEQAKEDARIAKEQAKINEDMLKSKKREKDKESEKQQKDGRTIIENNKSKITEEQDKANQSLSEEDLEEKKDIPSPLPQRGSIYPLRKHDLITLQSVETTSDENMRASQDDRLFFSHEDLTPIKQIPLQQMVSTPSASSPLKSHWSVFKQVKNFNIFRQDKSAISNNNNMSPPDPTQQSPPTMTNKLSKQSSSIMLSPEKISETPTDLQKEYLRKLAENSHEFRYHQYLDSNFKETSLTNQLRKGIEVFVFLGKFRKKAIAAAKSLVDDFMLPNQLSSFHPIKGMKDLNIAEEPNNNNTNNNSSDLFQPNKSNENNLRMSGIPGNNTTRNQGDEQQQSASSYQQGYLDEESFFFMAEYNMIVRMSWTKLATVIPTYLSDYLNFNDKKGISYYDPQYMKQVGDQFRILKSIAASSLEIRKQDSSYLLRVPLSVIVEYRGFKLLVQAKPSYESNIVYGPNIQKNIYKEYKRNPKFQRQIETDAAKLRNKLRIKPHFFSWKPEIEALECILTFETEIHKSAGDRKTKAALIKYKQEAIFIDQDKEEDQFYIEKYHDFFPINTFLDCQFDERTQRFPRKIRPEILLKRKKPLNPEACFSQIQVGNFKKDNALQKIFSKLIEQQKKDQIDIQEVEEFVGQISGTVLHKLVHKFDNLEIIPYDSHTIEEALHSHGLNIKYISEVATLSKTLQVKLLFEQEMVARAIKNIIRYYLASVTFESKSSLIENSQQYPIIHSFHKGEFDRKQYYFNRVEEKQKESILEILNLTFEQSEQGQMFWEQINTQIFLEFGYKQEVSLSQFEEGGLLNAICYCSSFILTYGFDVFNKNSNDEVSAPSSSPQNTNIEGFASQILSDLNKIQNNQPVNTANKSNPQNSSAKSNQTPWEVWENLQKSSVKVIDIATTSDEKKDQLSQEDSDYQPAIFTMKNLLSFECESEMFDFSSLQITQFAEQNLQNDIAEQSQSLLIKDKLSQVLNSHPRERFFTLFSIAKKQFISGLYEDCIESCSNCIQCFDYYPSVLLVDPLCLLIKCYIILNQKPKILYLFWKTEEIINFNLGKMHPLHCEVLNTMATYYESAGQFEEQIILLKANCHLIEKIVGFRHQKTAQIMFELANVLDQQGMTRQALGYYENVFYMYQAIKGEQNKRSADIGYKIALETFQFNDWERSKKFSTYSLSFYEIQEQSYLNKIVDLKILQFKILKSKKLEVKTEKLDQNFGNTSTNTSTINYNNSGLNNAITNKENNNTNSTNAQQINESISEIWQFMRKNDYKEFDQFKELFGVYVDVYLSTLDQEIKHYLSQQFDLIVYELIRINVLDSLQQIANREKSKDILLQEILTESNNNDPYRLIERTFLIIAEYGSKKSATLITNEKSENEDQNSPIITRAKALFEHMICLLGVNYFKTHFLSFFL